MSNTGRVALVVMVFLTVASAVLVYQRDGRIDVIEHKDVRASANLVQLSEDAFHNIPANGNFFRVQVVVANGIEIDIDAKTGLAMFDPRGLGADQRRVFKVTYEEIIMHWRDGTPRNASYRLVSWKYADAE